MDEAFGPQTGNALERFRMFQTTGLCANNNQDQKKILVSLYMWVSNNCNQQTSITCADFKVITAWDKANGGPLRSC